MKNSLSINAIADRIDELAKERKNWEGGAYKTSNAQLYALLDNCLSLYTQVLADRRLIRRVTQMLDEQGIPHNASTKLVTKIVRLVFGDCGRRAYVYARVISVAHATKTENISLARFIANAGGIDEIRRTNGGVTPSQRKRVHAEHADRHFNTSSALIEPIRLIDQLQPSSEAGNDYAVALVRRNTDGTGSIVYGTANPALVRSVLAVAGAAIKSTADIAAADAAKALVDQKKSEAIAAIAAA